MTTDMDVNQFIRVLELLLSFREACPSEDTWHYSGRIHDVYVAVDLNWRATRQDAQIITDEFETSGSLEDVSGFLLAAFSSTF